MMQNNNYLFRIRFVLQLRLMRCDFCGCRQHAALTPMPHGWPVPAGATGWLACAVCTDLIQSWRPEALLLRALQIGRLQGRDRASIEEDHRRYWKTHLPEDPE